MAAFDCCGRTHHPDEWSLDGAPLIDDESGEVTECTWDDYGRALCPECGTHAPNEHAGFGHVSKLYSHKRPLSELFKKWILAQGDINSLRTFINTQLGEPFEETGEMVDAGQFEDRLEFYDAEIPYGAVVGTAGVDIQADRIELENVWWGAEEENWGVEYVIIHGDTFQPYVWARLAEELKRVRTDAKGRQYVLQCAAIDANYRTQKVIDFIIANPGRRWFAIRGDRESINRRPVWPLKAHKTKHRNFDLYTIGSAAAKDQVMGRLSIDRPGPGYSHFPRSDAGDAPGQKAIARGYGETYFEQLTSEVRVTRRSGVTTYYQWKPRRPGIRNEAHDCRVYAYAALEALKGMGLDLNKVSAQFGYESRLLEGHEPEQPAQRLPRKVIVGADTEAAGTVPAAAPAPRPKSRPVGKRRVMPKRR
jgi:phage terminase large subunit GpA-like protein